MSRATRAASGPEASSWRSAESISTDTISSRRRRRPARRRCWWTRPVPTRPVPTPAVPWVRVADSRRAAGPLAAAFHATPRRRSGSPGSPGRTARRRWPGCSTGRSAGCADRASSAAPSSTGSTPATTPRSPPAPRSPPREAADFQAFLARARAAAAPSGRWSAPRTASNRAGSRNGLRGGGLHQPHTATTSTSTGTLDGYYEAKRRLFTEHLRPEAPRWSRWTIRSGPGCWRNSPPPARKRRAAVSATGPARRSASPPSGPASGEPGCNCLTPEGPQEIASPLLGDFNGQNLAAAWAAATALGLSGAEAAAALSEAEGPPGRMERISASGATRFRRRTRGGRAADGAGGLRPHPGCARAGALRGARSGRGRPALGGLRLRRGPGPGQAGADGGRGGPARRPGPRDLGTTPAARTPRRSSPTSGKGPTTRR